MKGDGHDSSLQVAHDVLDSLLEGCQVVDFDCRYLYVNDAVVAQGRQSREQLLGRTMMECYPGIDETPMFVGLRRCMVERKHDRMENEFTFPDGSKGWFELRFIPVPEGTCILSLDVTGQK
ncbi:MAG: PAS domain-containing protein, partial [Polyangiaceae bacterium]